jgi:hypothetical protein
LSQRCGIYGLQRTRCTVEMITMYLENSSDYAAFLITA